MARLRAFCAFWCLWALAKGGFDGAAEKRKFGVDPRGAAAGLYAGPEAMGGAVEGDFERAGLLGLFEVPVDGAGVGGESAFHGECEAMALADPLDGTSSASGGAGPRELKLNGSHARR